MNNAEKYMPELDTIAGQRVIRLDNKEAFTHHMGGSLDQDFIDATFSELSHDSGPLDSPNKYPVFVQEDRYVLPRNGTFSDRELKIALELGHIVCDPLPSDTGGARINGSSIDVTMGHYFYTAGKHNGKGIYNPFDEEDTLRYFDVTDPETGYKTATPWENVKTALGKEALDLVGNIEYLKNIPPEHPMVLLRPGERILAHTNEFIGILPPGTTSMQARSTTGRIGLSACYCAGWGDPGFIDRWTMEIHNLNENEHLPIPVGFRIAQVVFNMTGPVDVEYSQATGNYQTVGSHDLTGVKRAWRPHHMLPKAYKSSLDFVNIRPVEGLSEGLK